MKPDRGRDCWIRLDHLQLASSEIFRFVESAQHVQILIKNILIVKVCTRHFSFDLDSMYPESIFWGALYCTN